MEASTWNPYVRVLKDKKEALRQIMAEDFQIFTDGSQIDGGVGASAIVFKNGRKIETVRKHLGDEEDHTVFEAEIAGAIRCWERTWRAR